MIYMSCLVILAAAKINAANDRCNDMSSVLTDSALYAKCLSGLPEPSRV